MTSRLLLTALALLSSCTKEEKSTYLAPPAYQTLHILNSGGAFFQINDDGDFYIASSIHQGGAAPKKELFYAGKEAPVILTKRVHLQRDLHLWEYDSETLSDHHALDYHADVKITKGDRIFILNRGQKIAATVVALPEGKQFRYTYQTDQPFPAGGMSGSPVFLPRSGSVIGVLQTANDRKAATVGGFEKLKLP